MGTYEGFWVSPRSRKDIDAFVQGGGSVLFLLLRILSLFQSKSRLLGGAKLGSLENEMLSRGRMACSESFFSKCASLLN